MQDLNNKKQNMSDLILKKIGAPRNLNIYANDKNNKKCILLQA
jgi:hypothetical protein